MKLLKTCPGSDDGWIRECWKFEKAPESRVLEGLLWRFQQEKQITAFSLDGCRQEERTFYLWLNDMMIYNLQSPEGDLPIGQWGVYFCAGSGEHYIGFDFESGNVTVFRDPETDHRIFLKKLEQICRRSAG